MKVSGLFLLFLSTCLFCASAGASGITKSNWNTHPAILEIRAIVAEVNSEGAMLIKSEKAFAYCQPYEDTLRVRFTDTKGVVRKYHFEGGSDDSGMKSSFYYDRSGRLRFALIKAGAVNGTAIEHRIYFSVKGKRVWEFQKKLEGPGYTFPSSYWPDERVVFYPVKRFKAPNACQ